MLVTLVGNRREEGFQLQRACKTSLQFDTRPRVRVITKIFYKSSSHGLREHIFIRLAALKFATQTSVEVVSASAAFVPEGDTPFGEQVVDQLRDRSMELSHHLAEFTPNAKVTDRVIMVAHQSCDPRIELMRCGPMFEAVPEDFLGASCRERRKPVPAPGRDEINAIVPVPMLEAMPPVEKLMIAVRAFLHQQNNTNSPDDITRRAHFSEPVPSRHPM